MYKEYSPCIELMPYIDKYWVTEGSMQGEHRMRIAADGCVDIIFASGDTAYAQSIRELHPYVVGTMDAFSEKIFANHISMIGIRFNPAGITAFIRTPVSEMTNETFDLEYIESLFDEEFYYPLQILYSVTERLSHIENYLLSKLPDTYKMEKRILHVINLINLYNGTLSIKEITDNACLSPRQMERLFKTSVGISAKTYSRIARLKSTTGYLKRNPEESLFSVAINCGYSDHSHLIKEFNILTGESPTLFSK